MSVKTKAEREQVDQIHKSVTKRFNAALYDIGFLKGTVGNNLVKDKISGSFSGHTLDISIRAVVDKVALYVARSWENNGNSIPKLIDALQGWGPQLEDERRSRHPDWPDHLLEIGKVEKLNADLKSDADNFIAKPDFQALRVYRDEWLAHSLDRSGVRKRLERANVEVEPVTYSNVIELAETTSDFVRRTIQIWEFSLKDPNDWIERSRKNTELFWITLPKLSDAESLVEPDGS